MQDLKDFTQMKFWLFARSTISYQRNELVARFLKIFQISKLKVMVNAQLLNDVGFK